MKKFIALSVSATLLFAADFSKMSNAELQALAGSVAPKEVLSYRAEVHKRIDGMSAGEARAFRKGMHEARDSKFAKMSDEERKKYREEIRSESQKQLDKMSVKEAREKGLLECGSMECGHSGKGHKGKSKALKSALMKAMKTAERDNKA